MTDEIAPSCRSSSKRFRLTVRLFPSGSVYFRLVAARNTRRVKAERLPSPESNRIRKSGDFVNQGAPEKNKGGSAWAGEALGGIGDQPGGVFPAEEGGRF
jgi:hypothetical protein